MDVLHHEDEELLGRHYGSPENIPPAVIAAYRECHKFWCGAIGGSGPLPGGSLISLVAFQSLMGTVAVSPLLVSDGVSTYLVGDGVGRPRPITESPEVEPPLGDVHAPILDLKPNTPVRAKGQLGYFVKPWGNEQVCVRLEGEKSYRRFSINDVELAV